MSSKYCHYNKCLFFCIFRMESDSDFEDVMSVVDGNESDLLSSGMNITQKNTLVVTVRQMCVPREETAHSIIKKKKKCRWMCI